MDRTYWFGIRLVIAGQEIKTKDKNMKRIRLKI